MFGITGGFKFRHELLREGNKEKTMRNLFLLFILLAYSSCITIQAPQVKNVSNLQTSGLLSGNPHLDFNIQMYNPNSISLALADFKVDVKYGNLSLASLHLDTLQQVAAQSNFIVPLSFQPSQEQINNILQSGLGIFNQGSGAKLTGSGSIRVQKFIFGKTFQFRF